MNDPEEDDRRRNRDWPVDLPWLGGDPAAESVPADVGERLEELASGVRSGAGDLGDALADVEVPALPEDGVVSSVPVEDASVSAADADEIVETGGEAVALSVEAGEDVATVLVDAGDEAIEVAIENGGEEAAEAIAEALAASLEGL